MRDETADLAIRTLIRFFAQRIDRVGKKRKDTQETLGTAAFICEFGGNHLPPLPRHSDNMVVRHKHVFEEYLGEILIAGDIFDRTARYAERGQVDHHLGQSCMALRRLRGLGPEQADHVMSAVSVRRPYLAAIDVPP